MNITCSTCAWFNPAEDNPSAGMGECRHEAAHGFWHAEAKHRCRDHESTGDEDAPDQT